MHKISKLKFLKALTFQCIRPLMSKPLTRSQAEGLFIKDRNTLKSQGFKAFQFHFQKPGIDKKCIRWGLLVCLCSCLVYKYGEASTWKNPADTCCKVFSLCASFAGASLSSLQKSPKLFARAWGGQAKSKSWDKNPFTYTRKLFVAILQLHGCLWQTQ